MFQNPAPAIYLLKTAICVDCIYSRTVLYNQRINTIIYNRSHIVRHKSNRTSLYLTHFNDVFLKPNYKIIYISRVNTHSYSPPWTFKTSHSTHLPLPHLNSPLNLSGNMICSNVSNLDMMISSTDSLALIPCKQKSIPGVP
jgi:hypothetical protein